MESDHAEIQENFFYSTSNINDTGNCTGNYVSSADNISINSNSVVLDSSTDTFASTSKVRVFLQDANGISTSKEFALNVKQPYELVISNDPTTTSTTPQDIENGDVENFFNFVTDADNGNGEGEGNKNLIFTSETLTIYQNQTYDALSAFYGCESADFPTLPCPKFGNNGVLAVYFTTNFTKNPNTWRDPMGFTFAIIRSKYETVNGYIYSTENAKGGVRGSGIGYGGGYTDLIGIYGGNSFAVEFDLYQNYSYKNDVDSDHIAIVNYSQTADNNGTFDINGVYNNDHTYSTYGNNRHMTYEYNGGISTNDPCTVSGQRGGTGCYYNHYETVIPNNYGRYDANLFGVRIEALSGCNEDGTVCDKKTGGAENHICVYMWKEMRSRIETYPPELKTDMMDVTLNHAFNSVMNGEPIRLGGTPLVKDCFVDDTTTRNTLDFIRFGFTTGNWDIAHNQFFYQFTEFSAKVSEY